MSTAHTLEEFCQQKDPQDRTITSVCAYCSFRSTRKIGENCPMCGAIQEEGEQ